MKKLIHSDNYESFYLDYLEGTLSEDERIAFEEFLDAHPELRVDEELITLDDAPEFLGAFEKELLKKDEDERFITTENLDYFAIGKVEQVLSTKENQLFDTYLSANPEAHKVVAAYEETRLEASIVAYPNKEDLKEKEIAFVSWKWIAGIASAAALLLLFFQLGLNSGKNETLPNTIAQGGKTTQKTKTSPENKLKTDPTNQAVQQNTGSIAQKNELNSNPSNQVVKEKNPNQKVQPNEDQLIPLQPETDKKLMGDNTPQHHPTILPEVKDNKKPVAPTLNEEVKKVTNNDYASNTGNSSNMKNPIPIITNTISEKTKTPVDFKTGKATETEKGGFFLKIGKFEVSHKSSKKK